MTYLITFSCYASHLHGNELGSVDRDHNLPGSRLLEFDPRRLQAIQRSMRQPPYLLDRLRRSAVLKGLQGICSYRGWTLLAAHVRTNHVHVVVDAEARPEKVLNDLKSYASRHLNQSGIDEVNRKRWARHGSTRWLWSREEVSAAIRYVIDGHGEAMAVFETSEI
ncbi:MAG: transposase [Bryobacteraceae bacterium]